MWRYVLKRLVTMVFVLLGTSLMVFLILSMAPGTPANYILGANATPEQLDELNHELGYDRPVLERYVNYIGDLLKGDMGTSFRTRQPVSGELFSRFKPTLLLALFSIVLTSVIGIPTGIISAVKQYSLIDGFFTITALILAAVPGFWLGMMMIMLFAVRWHILPVGGIALWSSFIMPVFALAVCHSAAIMRLTRSAMLETVRMDYIRTARAKGASERRVIIVHALKNALLPIVTTLGGTFTTMLGGTIVIEVLFTIPGTGNYLINAILQRDTPVVVSTAVFISSLSCLVILLVDLLYAVIDPRIKGMYIKGGAHK